MDQENKIYHKDEQNSGNDTPAIKRKSIASEEKQEKYTPMTRPKISDELRNRLMKKIF